MATKRRPRRRDLRRGRDLRIGVVGSPDDVLRLRAVCRDAILGFPAGAQALDDAVRLFLSETAAFRPPPRVEQSEPTIDRPARSGAVFAIGCSLLIVVLMASIAAATAALPDGRFDPDPELSFFFSTGAAYAVVFAAIVGAALPPWGRADSRALAWQLHLTGAVCLAVGLVASLTRAAQDVDEVGSGPWTSWVVANVVALMATVMASVIRKGHADRWIPVAGFAPPKPQRRTHTQYVTAVRGPLSQAARSMDRFGVEHRAEIAAVDEAWRAGVDAAQRKRQVSRAAADRARAVSAYRWCLEQVAAVPDEIDYRP